MIYRSMLSQAGERTLIGCIITKGAAHIDPCVSTLFSNNNLMLIENAIFNSLPADFFVKSTAKARFTSSFINVMPFCSSYAEKKNMLARNLTLNSLTTHYAELYEQQFKEDFQLDNWTKKADPRLNQNFFKNLTPNWQRNVALRTDYERRQALVEIDVLVAMELGLSLDELKTIYRIQFPVLKQNENETFYDMNGRIVFTISKGLTGVGLPRKAVKGSQPCKIIIDGIEEEKVIGWEDIADMQEGEIHRTITDDTQPGGPIERTIIYKAPFAKCNREDDYEIAWAEFERRGNINE